MKEYIDYVFVENAKTIGVKDFTEQVKGLFVGTKNYFFFFPEKATLFQPGYATDKITETTYTYMGKPVPEYVLERINEIKDVSNFELEITTSLKDDIGAWIRIFPMRDISEFKVNAGWFGSGIVARFNSESYSGIKKHSATPIALSFGKKKKLIKEFYSTHHKLKS